MGDRMHYSGRPDRDIFARQSGMVKGRSLEPRGNEQSFADYNHSYIQEKPPILAESDFMLYSASPVYQRLKNVQHTDMLFGSTKGQIMALKDLLVSRFEHPISDSSVVVLDLGGGRVSDELCQEVASIQLTNPDGVKHGRAVLQARYSPSMTMQMLPSTLSADAIANSLVARSGSSINDPLRLSHFLDLMMNSLRDPERDPKGKTPPLVRLLAGLNYKLHLSEYSPVGLDQDQVNRLNDIPKEFTANTELLVALAAHLELLLESEPGYNDIKMQQGNYPLLRSIKVIDQGRNQQALKHLAAEWLLKSIASGIWEHGEPQLLGVLGAEYLDREMAQRLVDASALQGISTIFQYSTIDDKIQNELLKVDSTLLVLRANNQLQGRRASGPIGTKEVWEETSKTNEVDTHQTITTQRDKGITYQKKGNILTVHNPFQIPQATITGTNSSHNERVKNTRQSTTISLREKAIKSPHEIQQLTDIDVIVVGGGRVPELLQLSEAHDTGKSHLNYAQYALKTQEQIKPPKKRRFLFGK